MQRKDRLVVIGASSGGLNAFQKLVSNLPVEINDAIVFVQHIPQDFDSRLSDLLEVNGHSKVTEIGDKLPIRTGLYVTPAGYHCSISPNGYFCLDVDELVRFSRPSIDVLFESAAKYWGAHTIGILLTGANTDGSQGLKAIREAGGMTIAQDPSEAEVPVMPQAAIDAQAASEVWTIDRIANFLSGSNRS